MYFPPKWRSISKLPTNLFPPLLITEWISWHQKAVSLELFARPSRGKTPSWITFIMTLACLNNMTAHCFKFGWVDISGTQEHNVNLYLLYYLQFLLSVLWLFCFDRTELLVLTAEIIFINDTTNSLSGTGTRAVRGLVVISDKGYGGFYVSGLSSIRCIDVICNYCKVISR